MEESSNGAAIEEALSKIGDRYPSFAYPWVGLESFMDASGMSLLPLIGYGSLINAASAGRTINVGSDSDRTAVIAYGAVRVFNYRMPSDMLAERYGTPETSRFVAALNCEISGRASDTFNGILTQVKRDRLDPLRDREKGYALKPVVYRPWDQPEASLEVAYIFELLSSPDGRLNPYDESIFPHVAYTQLCQEGAEAISPEFLSYFNATSFLADKETALANYTFPADTI